MLQSGICTSEEEDIVDDTVQQCYRVGYVLMRKKILLTTPCNNATEWDMYL